MDPKELATWWQEAAHEGTWWAPWRNAVEGLTAAQAAWTPAPNRHAIWHIVEHMTHWRNYFAHRNLAGAPEDELALEQQNWQEIQDPTDQAWQQTVTRFHESHARVHAIILDPTATPPKPQLDLRYLLMHDSYHIGQVMYIRSLMGLEALES